MFFSKFDCFALALQKGGFGADFNEINNKAVRFERKIAQTTNVIDFVNENLNCLFVDCMALCVCRRNDTLFIFLQILELWIDVLQQRQYS